MLLRLSDFFEHIIKGRNMRAIKLNGGNVETIEEQFLSYSRVFFRVKISLI